MWGLGACVAGKACLTDHLDVLSIKKFNLIGDV